MENQPPNPSPHTLAERLKAARRRRFVGRRAELELFSTLLAPESPTPLLFIHGPGGVGKSSLLRECAALAEAAGAATVWIDCRDVEPAPAAFERALAAAALPTPREAGAPRAVWFLDTAEALAPLDGWLREQYLPRLPDEVLVVMAGRTPPSAAWREAGWSDLMRVVSLRNLPPEDSLAYLAAQGVPESRQAAVVAATHGHPLALSLAGDLATRDGEAQAFELSHAPDLLRLLLDRFVQQIPSPRHREALEISAQARVTSEALLVDLLGEEGASLFQWLCDLSFIEQHPQGIFPHDLARDVLASELRWRNPGRHTGIHRRVRRFAVREFERSRGLAQQRAFFDLLYMHKGSAMMRPYYDWERMGEAFADASAPGDGERIVQLVQRHESEEAARIAAYWIEAQPHGVRVFRRPGEPFFGFAANLFLAEPDAEQRRIDPAAENVWRFVQERAPLRAGETLLLQRFWGGAEGYQLDKEAHNLVAMESVRLWVTTPGLAWGFVVLAEPEHYHEMFTYLRFQRLPAVEFTVSGRAYGVYMHDWRAEPGAAWLDAMAERELATERRAAYEPPAPAVIVLSQSEFRQSVREALRDFQNPPALARNPLMHSRLTSDGGGRASVERLRQLLVDAASALRSQPRGAKFYRALHFTYFEPLATQELAAERLDLPFGTYRYHLSSGIERVTEWLWHREVHGAADG